MSRLSREAFERLAVDNLDDLWPGQADPDADPTMAVSSLEDLFPAREPPPVPIVETHSLAASDPSLEVDGLDDYFRDREEASASFADDDESDVASGDGQVFESEIQRAAMEFQRFAEKFHSFASECQRGVGQAAR